MFLIGKPEDEGDEYAGLELETMFKEMETKPNQWICYGKVENGDFVRLEGYEDLSIKTLRSVKKIA